MFWQNVRFAWRSLFSNPGFAVAAILALAIAIGLNTAMFSIVDGILLKPLEFKQPEDLFIVQEQLRRASGVAQYPLAPGNFRDYRAIAKSADLVAYAISPFSLTLSDSNPERYPGVAVTEGWFQLYGARIILGRDFSQEDHEVGRDEGVIISEGLWADRFGSDMKVENREIRLNGRLRKVIGVVESRFNYPPKTKIWAPLALTAAEMQSREFHRLVTQGRVRPGFTISQARSEFENILANLARQFPEFNGNKISYVKPMANDMTDRVRPALIALIGAVAFVLAIACANVANLVLARSSVRRAELAVRASLGASRGALMMQLLTESFLLSFLGGVLGLLIAIAAFFAFKFYAPQNLPRLDQIAIDLRVVAYNLLAVLLTGTVFGLVPAIRMSRVELQTSLKDRTRGGSTRTQFRSLLVVCQVAVALMLMTGAGLLIRSFYALTQVELGFNPDRILSMNVTPLSAKYDKETEKQVEFGKAIIRNVSELPGVAHVALTSSLPFIGNLPRYLMNLEGGPPVNPTNAPMVEYATVSPEYFKTMQIPVIAGRVFSESDNLLSPHVAIVNEAFVRNHFPGRSVIGKRLEIGFSNPPEWRQIVGVVKDVRALNMDQPIRPQIYAPFFKNPSLIETQATTFSVVVKTKGDPALLANAIREKVLLADNSQPVWQVRTMESAIDGSLSRERFTLFLMAVFASVAFVLAIIGLSGVLSYTVAQRTREIGIRLAVGAQPSEVLWMILRHALLLVSAGIIGGIVGSMIVSSALKNLLFKTSPFDPPTFIVISLIFLLTAVVSGLIPARRAAMIDPAITLRAE